MTDRPLRVLLTNNRLTARGGTETFLYGLATGLLRDGHAPVVYSTELGEAAEALRRATVPVVDELSQVGAPPDVIHGQHHLETTAALLSFPGVPALFMCHGWLPWQEHPPRFRRIRRYVAVDTVCRDRLVLENGVDPARVTVVPNRIDPLIFRPRDPLPARPRRALLLCNYTRPGDAPLRIVEAACARAGLALDCVGQHFGNATPSPERLLVSYDLVFAKARTAMEALTVGCAVIVYAPSGFAGLVDSARFGRWRRQNFGIRTLTEPLTAGALYAEIARYDAADATRVAARLRADGDPRRTLESLLALYREVVAEGAADDPEEERRETVRYLTWLRRHPHGAHVLGRTQAPPLAQPAPAPDLQQRLRSWAGQSLRELGRLFD